MYQTSYLGIVPLHRNTTYWGGFCQFFYIPVEYIDVFPRVNSANQQLVAEPSLKPGKTWFGPMKIPRDRLGYTETPRRTKAGIYYETKITGLQPGDSAANRVNIDNMMYHRYMIAAQVRAGGFYMLIGSPESYLQFSADYNTGNGPADTAFSQITFSGEQIHKGLILPSFAADTTAPGEEDDGNENEETMNQKEIISFVDQATINIPWTATRQNKFGGYPMVQVWIKDGDDYYLHLAGEIYPDQPAPAFTELTVHLGGNPSGFIVIA